MENLGPALLVLAWLAVFLMCREIVCWYFKINETNALLRDIGRALGAEPAPPQVLPRWLVGAPAGTYSKPAPKVEDSPA